MATNFRNPAQWLIDWLRGSDGSSTPVTNSSMLGSAAIWYAVTTIAGDVAKMPLDSRRLKSGGGSNVDERHPGWRLLREEPNSFQTADVFKEQLQSHALGWGNGRAAIVRKDLVPIELIPLQPDRTATVMVGGKKYHVTSPCADDPVRFKISVQEMVDGKPVPPGVIVLPDDDVLHILGFGSNGFDGLNIAKVARDSIGIDLQSQSYQRRQMQKGFTGKMMLQAPAGVMRDEDDAKKFLTHFRKSYSHEADGEAIGLLREGITANVSNMSNVDAQFLELRKFSRQDVMLWFGLQHIPGDNSSVSYNSLEQKQLAYLASCLDRWLIRWEMQCDAKLRTNAEKAARQVYFKFNRGSWLRTDIQTTAAVLVSYVQAKILNKNEARDMLDRNPADGGDVFENPAIQVKPTTEKEASASMVSRINALVAVEANQVHASAVRLSVGGKNFLAWLDSHYDQWSKKLESVAIEIGADASIVTSECESRRLAIVAACDCPASELAARISAVTELWKQQDWSIK